MTDNFEDEGSEFDVEEHSAQLLTWFRTLKLAAPCESVHVLVDGEAFVEALQSLDHSGFSHLPSTTSGEDKVKLLLRSTQPDFEKLFDDGQTSFLLNLQERILEYIEDQQRRSGSFSRQSFSEIRDRVKSDIVGGDVRAISRIIQLILVCAVICPDREVYINDIRTLDEDVTVILTKAILQVIPVKNEHDSDAPRADPEWRSADDACDKCNALQNEINQLLDEKKKLLLAKAKLQADSELVLDFDNERSPVNKKFALLQRETVSLREALTKSESSRDELRIKFDDLQKQLASSIVESEQLRRRGAEVDRLKDEVDEWKHAAALSAKFENENRVYRKKIEEIADLKQQCRSVEGRNTELMKRNIELEQENAQMVILADAVEKQQKDLNISEQELHLCKARLQAKELTIKDLEDQITSIEKLNMQLQSGSQSQRQDSFEPDQSIRLEDSLASELLPTAVKEEMLRLQLKNDELAHDLAEYKKRATASTDLAVNKAQHLVNGSEIPEGYEYSTGQDLFLSNLVSQEDHQKADSSVDSILAQRDAQIQELEHQLEFLRRHYGNQQKLMTVAWYRLGLKTEQQALNSRVFGGGLSEDNFASNMRPYSFLEEQRKAVIAPVNSSPRAQNSVSSPRLSSRAASQSFRH